MALDDAQRRTLEEIEQRLRQDSPDLRATFAATRPRLPRLQPTTVLAAVAIFLVCFAWLSLRGGTAVPVLVALPPAIAAVLVLLWQHTQDCPPTPPAD